MDSILNEEEYKRGRGSERDMRHRREEVLVFQRQEARNAKGLRLASGADDAGGDAGGRTERCAEKDDDDYKNGCISVLVHYPLRS